MNSVIATFDVGQIRQHSDKVLHSVPEGLRQLWLRILHSRQRDVLVSGQLPAFP